jgi:hypothetical protein
MRSRRPETPHGSATIFRLRNASRLGPPMDDMLCMSLSAYLADAMVLFPAVRRLFIAAESADNVIGDGC